MPKIYAICADEVRACFTIKDLADDYALECKIKFFKNNDEFELDDFRLSEDMSRTQVKKIVAKYNIDKREPLYDQIKGFNNDQIKEIMGTIEMEGYDVIELELFA